MHHFHYTSGILHAEDVALEKIAAEVRTPFYCYSTATLERHYEVLAKAFADQNALICWAVKANSNQAVLATFARLGCGMDVVSEGELRRAPLAFRLRKSSSPVLAKRATRWPTLFKKGFTALTLRANLNYSP